MKKKHMPKARNKKLNSLIIANIFIIVFFTFICFHYSHNIANISAKDSKKSFSATVSIMENTAHSFLDSQQEICDDWADYISSQHWTPDEAIDYLCATNSNKDVMVHLVNTDTNKGFSTKADENGRYTVDYAEIHKAFTQYSTSETPDHDVMHISSMFRNPVNNTDSVGFSRIAKLVNSSGKEESYAVIRVVPVQMIKDKWVFPVEFADAELSLIKQNGDFIIRSDSMKGANFWEYLQISNDLDNESLEEISDTMKSEGSLYEGMDSMQNDAFFICSDSLMNQENNWYFVGYLPADSLPINEIDFRVIMYVVIGFTILIVIDGRYILKINRELKESFEQTRKANLAKTQFLSSMSHDIRTPMNAIIGMTTIAARHINEPEQVKNALSKINLASNHLLTLINDVLDISKVESGKMTLTPVVFSLPETITNIANIVRPNVKSKNLDFEIHVISVEEEYLFADELRLNQIYINLLSNAVKYTPENGRIVLTIEQKKVPDDPKMTELIYTVEDNGIGMSEEFQQKMYSTFTREVDTRIDKITGTGLGLAITKQMTELMNGTIECRSVQGEGTTFKVTLRLPIADRITDNLMLPPMKILLVDDDRIFLETAKDTLESLCLETDIADNGNDAVNMVVKKHSEGKDYPAVIIDWKMPGMGGLETTRRIRSAVGRDVPIIIISSYDWTDIEAEAKQAGADAFINKPMFRSTVYNTMSEIFSVKNSESAEDENESTEFEGMHVLIAEDNDINWMIIEELLSYSKITADRAENGKICIDMLSSADAGTYEMIFMDIQMPVMNGLDACRMIRSLDDESKKNIPVVAMTADAFSEDVKNCMDAGMNGHISKPIDMGKLFAELRKAGIRRK